MNAKVKEVMDTVEIEKTETVGRFTIVKVVDDIKRSAVGISRVGTGDRFSKEKGFQIARGRALKSLLLKIEGKRLQSSYMG